MVKKVGVPYQETRNRLSLAVWQMRLIEEERLLFRLPDGSFDVGDVEAAESNADIFADKVRAVERLNATEAALDLGVPVARFRRVMGRVDLEPTEVVEVRKYGQVLNVKKWRRKDLRDFLLPELQMDEAVREATLPVARSASAKKGAQTRKRNAETIAAARASLDSLIAAGASDDGATAQLCRLYFMIEGGDFSQDAVLAAARLADSDRERYLRRVLEATDGAIGRLVPVPAVARQFGVTESSLRDAVPVVGGRMDPRAAQRYVTSHPRWLASARAACEQHEHAERSRAAAEERRIIEERVALQSMSYDEVAGVLGIAPDEVRRLRRNAGWRMGALSTTMARPIDQRPMWAQGAERAREYILETEARLSARADDENRRADGRRKQWAQHFGVAADLVPTNFARKTEFTSGHKKRALQGARRFAWVESARQETESRRRQE